MRTARNTFASLALAAMAALAAGCSYSLDGKVTEGFGSVIIGRPLAHNGPQQQQQQQQQQQ